MDITPLFKACIKNVRTRNKTLGVGSDEKVRQLRPTRPRGSFAAVAKDITSQVTRLRDFLLEHRSAYLSCLSAVATDQMSDAEREQLDAGAQRIVNTCAHLVRDFRADNLKLKVSPQTREYMSAVIELIDSYLKCVCKIHSELKALRVKRALDLRKLSRLELRQAAAAPSRTTAPAAAPDDVPAAAVTHTTTPAPVAEDTAAEADATGEGAGATVAWNQDDDVSPEELQMLETENHQLYGRLNNLSEEVRQIESKVLHIAQLQEIFTEKVLQQEGDIERIATTVVGATENVRDANQQIRQAMQRNAGLRVYVLFFLLLMSFTLLFLDWYND